MAPLRDHLQASTSKARHTKKRQKNDRNAEETSHAAPGIQKIKASLRQTRRLLAKDKLAADFRMETERRLKALEADLQTAEIAKKERTFAIRYHKIKFFERQKVIRKIKQVQNQLGLAQKTSKKTKLTSELQELRVDLNYIFHYPRLKKYISLFPPDDRKGDAVSQPEGHTTDAERMEIRNWIRDRMNKGELSVEPEVTLASQRGTEGVRTRPVPPIEPGTKLNGSGREEDEFFSDDNEENKR